MRIRLDSWWRVGEPHRYFPDFVDSLPPSQPELEADRNSYLAGGYAEEFGYRPQPGISRGVLVLDGESPEQSPEAHLQAGALHPGYPLRPHPRGVEFDWAGDGVSALMVQLRVSHRNDGATQPDRAAAARGTFFLVSNRPYARERQGMKQRVVVMAMRFTAALASVRWSLSHLRHSRY